MRAGSTRAAPEPGLAARAARGAAWSSVSSLVLRLGGVVVGIVLARILAPEQFGVFAIAITVQGVLMTLADLGLSADIIRSPHPERIAPTVATLGLVSGAALAVATAATSAPTAALLGSPEAGPVIAVLSVTLLLAGATVVPYGMLQRRFQQRELFVVAVCDLIVSTVVTLGLVAAGFGALALAIGRVAAQATGSVLLFAFARVRPRFGLDHSQLRAVLAFGVPIAAANLLSWALLNADNVVLARTVGVVGLGYYVLAFNVSNWPMSALSQVVRSIALPYFSRTGEPGTGEARSGQAGGALAALTGVAWAAALPAGALLAVLSAALVEVVYGEKWLPAAPVLAALGVYGALRVVFDLFASYLYAEGRSAPVLWIQVASLIALVAGMLVATPLFGIVGAAWVHVAVALALILPGYLLAVRRAGARLRPLLRACLRPTIAVLPAAAVGWGLDALLASPLAALLAGGAGAAATYLLVVGPWLLARVRSLRSGAAPRPTDAPMAGAAREPDAAPEEVSTARGGDSL
ncbi:oligosaccharide flippase family protein [Microbacterium sp. NPDC096154]|uniref:oligosaccharide flippase family protein n=1 Tax=Microbacterium sp. NPDC096154 TaxID=3155549 RepID=UPI00332D0BC1